MNEKKYKKPRMKSHRGLWRKRVIRNWPFFVWLLIVSLVAHLYLTSDETGGMIGVVETMAEPVAALTTARLLSVDVTIGQKVKAGDIVAKMDTSLLDAQLATDEARRMEIESNITGFSQNMLQMVRQFDKAINDAEAQLEKLKSAQQSDIAQLEELKKEQIQRESLIANKLITRQETTILLPQIAALEKTVFAYLDLVKLHEKHLKKAQLERKDLQDALQVDEGEAINKAIQRKMKARLEILEIGMEREKIKRDSYILRATRDGIVSRIFHAPGDVVNAGDPILRLVSEKSNHVAGFLPENFVAEFKSGQKANVYRQNRKGGPIEAVVESVAPEVQSLPGRISPIRGTPVRGRRVLLTLTSSHDFIPGETVLIRKYAAGSGLKDIFSKVKPDESLVSVSRK
ncbi:HlyD family secretion protein [Verrucomicrobiota bacterium]